MSMNGVMFWSSIGGCLFGIFATLIYGVGNREIILCFVCACVCIGVARTDTRYAFILLSIAIVCITSGVGILRTQSELLHTVSVLDQYREQRVLVEGDVVEEPDERDTSLRVVVRVRSITDFATRTQVALDERMLVLLPPHTGSTYGDHLIVSGTVTTPQVFKTNSGRDFDYLGFLHAQGIDHILSFAKLVESEQDSGIWTVSIIYHIKNLFQKGERLVLPEPHASLASGILIGDKRSVGPDITLDFQRTSLTHVLVLSGYNITVVVDWMMSILSRVSPVIQSMGSLFVVVFFVILSGGSASAVRAGGMVLIVVVARRLTRTFDPLRALVVVTVGMVLWNPRIVFHDPSFQLSFLATLGLIVCSPYVSRYCTWITESYGIRELIVATCSTQITVAPYILYSSGTVSLVALPANMVVLIAMPLAMAFSAIAGFAGAVLGHLGTVFALPAYLTLSYILYMTHLFALVPYASITIRHISLVLLYAWYGGLIVYLFFNEYMQNGRQSRPFQKT